MFDEVVDLRVEQIRVAVGLRRDRQFLRWGLMQRQLRVDDNAAMSALMAHQRDVVRRSSLTTLASSTAR